ncbi:hypothetical protein A3B45_00985 [Candidatus Daviesbacteria bacterium RIFCSPLOWO2_01_FULL_39_12]|uniref:Prepilin-type N-terminal cleavage/methylation domain-containing protein n=1 Tax=Candidatus Daviesbacteria bacterium RIFCSPLOWO2_01_FULL_39_12 TaxID=1797785 RepID=A0A1F5KTK2_9BACT|nr:MAG: hypothetical protein A3D79_02080 [Candidatus Daviesbacteria bacterium RIFCSPHIGHO2_02_FULL_39_8]OGE44150.1 MAG: hypothetical protein A3B45_00985 [Candidatus Daviesbacteria bacterium RIFCSPLOWO2_01_FULL_39_12]
MKQRGHVCRQAGFSLVELLLYMGLFSILLVSLMQLFGSILAVRLESEATSAVLQDGRYILSRFAYDVKRSSNIVAPTFGTPGPELTITGPSINYTYKIVANNLVLQNNTTSVKEQLNSADTKISSATFTKLGTPGGKETVQIKVTLNSLAIRQGGNPETKTFQTTVGTR